MIMLQSMVFAFLLSLVSAQNEEDFSLAVTIPGVPGKCQFSFNVINCLLSGEDYPIFSYTPETSFLCDGRVAGYYADKEVDQCREE